MDLHQFLNRLGLLSYGPSYKPHKYVLLLAVLDIIQATRKNKILFDETLKDGFTAYFSRFKRVGDRNRPYTPFYYLKTSGFWHFKARAGRSYVLEQLKVGGPSDILNNIEYAYLDKPVFELFINPETAPLIRNHILSILEDSLQGDPAIFEEYEGEYETSGVGKSLFKHEADAIRQINALIAPLGRAINNVCLFEGQSNNYYEYDVIIVAYSGIYVVELKHWSGHICVRPYNWIINNTLPRTDPHKSNIFKCKILKGIYQHNFRTYPNIWVKSVVVLTNPESTVDGAHSPGLAAQGRINNPTFASIADLISYLKKRETAPGGHLLDHRQANAVIDYINGLNTPRERVKYAVPGFETIDYLSQKPECIELIARPLDGRAEGLNRFRVFRPPPQMMAEERERFMKKAYNTLNTVSQIGHHPHIQKVWVIGNDVGDIIEGSEWSETGTLRDLILQQTGSFLPDKAFNICGGILRGLDKAHRLGVIHRAVKPENILMFNGIPKLINFDLAYRVEDNRLTVIPDVSQVKDDGYTAPEVLLGGDIDESTDLFSVGVIAYEMLAGNKPFTSIREFLAQGGILGDKQLDVLIDLGLPEKSVEIIMDILVADRAERFKDIGRAIEILCPGTKGDDHGVEPSNVNLWLQPGDVYDVYEIVKPIDEGRDAQIYKARTLRGTSVVLKVFNKEVVRERIIDEAEITSAISSSYVVHSDNIIGHWQRDRYFLVLDYIPGETMRRKMERGETPDIETFRTVAFCLMEAVKAFHQHRDEEGRQMVRLHSDIKPDNIIITPEPGSKAVLIDCGIAGKPRVDVFQGTNGYVPPDSIRGADMEFSTSGDMFALGVTLWEWLFGQRPYKNPSVGDIPLVPADISADFKALMPWLLKAVATKAEERFAGIEEMLNAFIVHNKPAETGEALKDKVPETGTETKTIDNNHGLAHSGNPFVDYINSLSEASAGNENAIAESQLASGFFDRILVRNPLADFILETLVCDKINVILTGNAGDGKTTIAADIYRRITGTFPGTFAPKEKAGDVVIVKDMSELARRGERAAILEGALKDENNRYLIVSNTGTLLETFRTLKIGEKGADESNLLKALGADEPTFVLDDHFMVLNIANMDSIDTAGQVFERMLDGENWTTCLECQLFSDCPIFNNVRLLQENLQMVSERIILLYRRLYEYDVRLTMRQMTGHLAYAVTAGRSCADVRVMSLTALQECLDGSLFFNRVFGDDGDTIMPEAGQLLPVRKIREAEFGVLLDPLFERKAWVRGNVELPLKGQALKIGKELAKKNDPTARRQVRRLVYFFGQAGERYIATFLRSPMLTRFLEYVRGGANISGPAEEKYRRQILHVLQEYFVGVRLPEETRQWPSLYITLTPLGSGTNTQMVAATLRETDFNVFVKHRYKVGDNNSFVLCLRFRDSVRMVLNLPFLDFIARRYRGELAEELSAHYATRLEQFKVDLLDMDKRLNEGRERNLTLIRIKYGGGFDVIKMHVSGASLEVFS